MPSLPWIAIQAPDGAIARHQPSIRWENEVRRLVYEYRRMEPSAIGERISVKRLRLYAANKKSADETIVKMTANLMSRSLFGSARLAVRGLAASIFRSAMRLKVIAAERAPTIASVIQRNFEIQKLTG